MLGALCFPQLRFDRPQDFKEFKWVTVSESFIASSTIWHIIIIINNKNNVFKVSFGVVGCHLGTLTHLTGPTIGTKRNNCPIVQLELR